LEDPGTGAFGFMPIQSFRVFLRRLQTDLQYDTRIILATISHDVHARLASKKLSDCALRRSCVGSWS